MRTPALFLSHGAPINALYDDLYTQQLDFLAQKLNTPKAIVVLSAHGIASANMIELTASEAPELIYDFSGFPQALYELGYACPGAPLLAQLLATALHAAGMKAELNSSSGLDHGVWIPLLRLFPKAQIPVVQLYMPADATAESIYAIGQALKRFRNQDVLFIGSGGATHNLALLQRGMQPAPQSQWALEFMQWLQKNIQENNISNLFNYKLLAPHAQRAHPTAEHLYPLFFTLGLMDAAEHIEILSNDFTYSTLSTFSFFVGNIAALRLSYSNF